MPKEKEINDQLASIRKTQNTSDPGGYSNTSNLTVPVTGDDEAQYVKENPFVTEVQPYWTELELTSDDVAPQVGTTIDVAKWRVLIAYIEYTVGELTGDPQLSLLPEGAAQLSDPQAPYFPIGVINPAITPVTIDSDTAYGSRTMYQTELRAPVGPIRLTIAFDVTPYEGFRFQTTQISDGEAELGVLTLTYALSM